MKHFKGTGSESLLYLGVPSGVGQECRDVNFGDYLTPLTDAEGKQIAFANRVGALNYMAKEGWTLEPIETLDGEHKVLVMSKEVKSEAKIRLRMCVCTYVILAAAIQ